MYCWVTPVLSSLHASLMRLDFVLVGVSYDFNVGAAIAARPEEAALYAVRQITVLADIPGSTCLHSVCVASA